MDIFDGEPDAEAVRDVPKPLGQRRPNEVENRFPELRVGGVRQVRQHRLGGVDRFAGFDEPSNLCREVTVVDPRKK